MVDLYRGTQFLECQNCGIALKELSAEQQQQVANKPYNFVFYCKNCKEDLLDEAVWFYL